MGGAREMTMDALVKQRFCELDERATKDIPGTYSGDDGTSVDGEACHGWATSVLSLFERVFGKNSVHTTGCSLTAMPSSMATVVNSRIAGEYSVLPRRTTRGATCSMSDR